VAALTVAMAAIGGVVVVSAAVLHGETVARFLAVGYGLASTAVLSAVVLFLLLPFGPLPGGDAPGDPVVDLARPDR
jgi:tellurite resistance protein TehA-like permease